MENLILVKSTLGLVHPLSYEESVIYYKKCKCPVKWLDHFWKGCFMTNFEFIKKLDEAFRPVFEGYVGKMLNWNNMFILLAPYHGDFNMYKNKDSLNYLYVLTCRIGFSNTSIVDGNITWYINKPETEIDFYSNEFKHDIIVNWVPELKYSQQSLDMFPDYIEKALKVKLKIKLKFSVETYLPSMPHEGKFAITLWNVDDVEKVTNVLYQSRQGWNNQTDKARESRDELLERGYCHDIAFDGIEDKVAYWYIDAGSAQSS